MAAFRAPSYPRRRRPDAAFNSEAPLLLAPLRRGATTSLSPPPFDVRLSGWDDSGSAVARPAFPPSSRPLTGPPASAAGACSHAAGGATGRVSRLTGYLYTLQAYRKFPMS